MNKQINTKHQRKQKQWEQENKPPAEILRRESLFKSLGFAAVVSLFVSLLLVGIFSVLILSVKFPLMGWLSFLSEDLKMLAINGSALCLGIFLFISGTALSGYLRPPYSIVLSHDRIQFSKWGRRYDVAFEELIGVEQKFRIARFSFFWLQEYILYTPEQVIKLPIRTIEGHYKVEDRLLQRNEQLNNRKLEALEATAQLQASTDSSISPATRFTLTYSTIKTQRIIVDSEHNRIIFSEKNQLPADQIRKIIVDCNASLENVGGRGITFQQQDGRNFTIKTKNYACSDAEWLTLLQNLHIAAWKLNIPLEVDIPPNRPLHIFSVNDEKERAS
ncbi:hypothetical protein [Paenibacillus chitinolyticus]|uniref:hypothetical protein n=1 Tax=Paenibacillus chitinolyticus TaxID=79263 RepID=UPI00295E4112|nr:hypothetical protein [Paenibacillus chitinolyticus]